jgi:TolA-binding protein
MRFHLLGLILMASVAAPATPAAAQRTETVEQRVNRLESQLRAVQRRVFPNGNVEPEIGDQPAAGPGGNLSGDAIASLTSRVDALEAQLRTLTGQVEESGFRSRQLEQQIAQLRTDLGARIDRLEPAAPPPETRPEPAPPEPAPTVTRISSSTAPASSNDGAEEAYNAGFRLWDARRYEEAQTALEAAAVRYPSSRWTSWMRNLQGRAYLDDNKPATAARVLLANYQDNPEGERAADSLLYLGQALTRLNRRSEACRVYDELARVYPNMRAAVRTELPAARRAARCG